MKKWIVFLVLCYCFTTDAQVVVLHHHYYTAWYDTIKKAPVYTVYTLTKKHLVAIIDRKSIFYADDMVRNTNQGNDGIYKGNGKYDKGHLSPAADFCFNADAYTESMYYTNTAPQLAYFNEHLWEAVEQCVRDSCFKYGNVKVYTGCIYGTKSLYGLAVPDYYWKVIIYNHGKRVAWLGKNKEPQNNDPETIKDPVKDIETRTGLKLD